VLRCVAVCCGVLQCVAVCCSALQRVAVCCVSVLSCPAVRCSVLQCVAECCSVLQRVQCKYKTHRHIDTKTSIGLCIGFLITLQQTATDCNRLQ